MKKFWPLFFGFWVSCSVINWLTIFISMHFEILISQDEVHDIQTDFYCAHVQVYHYVYENIGFLLFIGISLFFWLGIYLCHKLNWKEVVLNIIALPFFLYASYCIYCIMLIYSYSPYAGCE